MKKIIVSILVAIIFCNPLFSQQNQCATTERFDALKSSHPEINQRWKKIEESVENNRNSSLQNSLLTQNVITIPVVVHVLYNTAAENISIAQVQSQIDVLNEDFRRLNADTNLTRTVFKPVAGDVKVEFCLAQRDPLGNVTTGITRTLTSRPDWGCDDSMKYSANGGIDPWDHNQYLNIYVCNLNCANGYAYYPGTPAPYDGVVVHYYVFGRTGNVAPGHLGRTGTHEVGHYLGLYHPFEYGSCVGTDTVSCGSAGDRICDTPASDVPGYGCDLNLNSCADSPVNLPNQIENFMDYADDNCRNMFSLDQVDRMRSMLNSYRNSLLLSPGCISPAANYFDASLMEIVKPFDEICSPSFVPVVRIGNISSASLTTLNINYQLDGGIWNTFAWTGNLSTGNATFVSLPSITVAPGIHNFSCYVSDPNGQPDQNATNDVANILFNNLTAGNGVNAFLTEGFEGGAFPPQGWKISNPDYDKMWMGTVDATGFGQSTAAAFFQNFYNGRTNTHDGLITPKLDFTTVGSATLAFNVAYSDPNSTFYSDTLKVFYSLDCGETWNMLYNQGGAQLSTAPAPVTFSEFIPDSSQWRHETVSLNSLAGNPLVTLKFENVSFWGNNLYLDDINIYNPLAVNEISDMSFIHIFPNPSDGTVFITGNDNSQKISLELLDALGQKVYSSAFTTTQQKIDLRFLKNGCYFLKTEVKGKVMVKKLIIAE